MTVPTNEDLAFHIGILINKGNNRLMILTVKIGEVQHLSCFDSQCNSKGGSPHNNKMDMTVIIWRDTVTIQMRIIMGYTMISIFAINEHLLGPINIEVERHKLHTDLPQVLE